MIYLLRSCAEQPAEIRITTPTINRNYGQLIQGTSVYRGGRVEGTDRMAGIADQWSKGWIKSWRQFQRVVNLVPGKNRVRVAAQNTQSQVISKDLYLKASLPAKDSNKKAQYNTIPAYRTGDW